MMTEKELKEIYKRSQSQILPPEIEKQSSGPTLKVSSLKFLAQLFEELKPKNIIEYGSGLSTKFMMDHLSQHQKELKIFSVDHSEFYLAQSINKIEKKTDLTPLWAPLGYFFHGGRSFVTYNPRYTEKIPPSLKFDVVFIDGPLGFFHREAPLYQVRKHLTPNTLVLLDDSHRPNETLAQENWKKYWGNTQVVSFGKEEPLSVIQILQPDKPVAHPWDNSAKIKSHIKSLRRMAYIWMHKIKGNEYRL